MSGLCGIVSTQPIEAGALGRMALALSSRGGVQQAARTLPSGETGRVLFDGRLDRSSLATRFEAQLALHPQEGDGELIGLLHRAVGDDLTGLLDGPFALAILEEDGLYLARDVLGQRPLYYCAEPTAFYFASEIKALLRVVRQAPRVDEQSLEERFVLHDHLLATSTLLCGVHRLRPGHCCRVTRRGHELSVALRAYQPGPETACDARSAEGRRALRDIVERNVAQIAARADSLGVLLSGGFDSSVLAALASRHYHGRVKTFTIAEDPEFPDAIAARRVAHHLRTEHREFIVREPPRLADLRAGLLAYEDLFYRDTLYLLAQKLRGTADVVLSGSGADLFGMPVLARQGRLRAVLASWRALAARLGPCAGERRIGRYMATFESALGDGEERAVFDHFTGEYIPSQLLPSTERVLSSVGVETAFPFANRALLAIASTLPAALKYGREEEKTALRAAFADIGLPPEILSRPKLCSKVNMLETKIALRDLAAQTMSDAEFSRKSRGGLLTTKFQAVCLDLFEEMVASEAGAR
jgi:asparagine synthetase B (glutamine-hydrolysing)